MKKLIAATILSGMALVGTKTAQATPDATFPYIDIMADAGSYSPVALGEDIQLDGCDTVVWAGSGTPTFSWCDVTNYTNFSFTWAVSSADDFNGWTTIGSFSGSEVGNALTMVANTGIGTAFAAAGNYYIALWAEVASSEYYLGQDVSVELPGGLIRYPGGDSELSYDGSTNRSAHSTIISVMDAVSVPEPIGALLLLPGFLYIARREKRRKQAVAA